MTMRDWIERVCQLQNAVETRDRRLKEQEHTIESQLNIIRKLRAEIARHDANPANSESHENPASKTRQSRGQIRPEDS